MKNTIFFAVFLIFYQSAFVACQRSKVPTSESIQQKEPPIELTNYTLHRVNLDWENSVVDSTGKTTKFKTAYLIKFSLKNLPTAYGPIIKFYIGDTPIREYGPWDQGIYFKIYKQEDLFALQGKQITYRFVTDQVISLQKRFEFAKPSDLVLESESEVLKKQ